MERFPHPQPPQQGEAWATATCDPRGITGARGGGADRAWEGQVALTMPAPPSQAPGFAQTNPSPAFSGLPPRNGAVKRGRGRARRPDAQGRAESFYAAPRTLSGGGPYVLGKTKKKSVAAGGADAEEVLGMGLEDIDERMVRAVLPFVACGSSDVSSWSSRPARTRSRRGC